MQRSLQATDQFYTSTKEERKHTCCTRLTEQFLNKEAWTVSNSESGPISHTTAQIFPTFIFLKTAETLAERKLVAPRRVKNIAI
ncbi:hypothetical protein ANANG_G00067330 [Anguilla anguilla]|uniref:Uncharacterized protein n=1 Tax=Anguilla anguilla TaxID=7936 RepID=A0A9D3MPT3_ANGAN|nr:hypothetical protein ANANG_G00067330 [Anguilla anguilla]